MIFRMIGIITMVGSLTLTVMILGLGFPGKYTLFFYTLLPYLITGIILIVLSKFLAKIVCFGFNKFNEL